MPVDYELIYCDDGSDDGSAKLVNDWHKHNSSIKLIPLSRNFGKENALTAGITMSKGEAIIMLDGDGQHPVELIPKFVTTWQEGAQVVVGLRLGNDGANWSSSMASRLFYNIFGKLADRQELVKGATDFRLIDRQVQQAFLNLPETDRITRGLIDWLGFRRQYVSFVAKDREDGKPSYGFNKRLGLAANSVTSLTPKPLFIFGYLGVFITLGSFLLGLAVIIEQLILGDPLKWRFTGTAMLGTLILFMVGIVLMSQGILALYISDIHKQSKRRPLYIIDFDKAIGISKPIDSAEN